MATRLFFSASGRTFDQVTQLFDFVWPTAAAMWNLRWQVQGYLTVVPNATVEELRGRFTQGSGIVGANLRRACAEQTWSEHQEEFARLLLVDVCAIYESWLGTVLEVLGSRTPAFEKGLQFPTVGSRGAWPTLNQITTPESSMLKAAFYPVLVNSRKNSRARLDNLLICYRFFKECRNALMHGGGLADQKVVDAHAAYQAVATPGQLDLPETPAHSAIALGNPIVLSLRGVVGLSAVVLRLIATLDAELSRSERAISGLRSRWLAINGRRYTLKKVSPARSRQIARLVYKLGMPRPASTVELDRWLRVNGLVN